MQDIIKTIDPAQHWFESCPVNLIPNYVELC